jgi:hypothetical protein
MLSAPSAILKQVREKKIGRKQNTAKNGASGCPIYARKAGTANANTKRAKARVRKAARMMTRIVCMMRR